MALGQELGSQVEQDLQRKPEGVKRRKSGPPIGPKGF